MYYLYLIILQVIKHKYLILHDSFRLNAVTNLTGSTKTCSSCVIWVHRFRTIMTPQPDIRHQITDKYRLTRIYAIPMRFEINVVFNQTKRNK